MFENRTVTLMQIEDILCNLNFIENKGRLDLQTGLLGRGIGLDSVDILLLVSSIEENFEITIDDDELLPEHFTTVGNLIEFTEELLGKWNSTK